MHPISFDTPVIQAEANTRASFIRKTYFHLAGAVLLFIVLEAALLASPLAAGFTALLAGNNLLWLLVLGAFVGVSFLADSWARSSTSSTMQYIGLGLYVLIEAIILMPLLFIAQIIPQAAVLTLALFSGLSLIALTSNADFSFLRGALVIGGFAALGVIIASMIFGFGLGAWFSGAMIVFAGGSILYETSNVQRHYRTDQHVAAALSLFASLALLFWYILRFLMDISRS